MRDCPVPVVVECRRPQPFAPANRRETSSARHDASEEADARQAYGVLGDTEEGIAFKPGWLHPPVSYTKSPGPCMLVAPRGREQLTFPACVYSKLKRNAWPLAFGASCGVAVTVCVRGGFLAGGADAVFDTVAGFLEVNTLLDGTFTSGRTG